MGSPWLYWHAAVELALSFSPPNDHCATLLLSSFQHQRQPDPTMPSHHSSRFTEMTSPYKISTASESQSEVLARVQSAGRFVESITSSWTDSDSEKQSDSLSLPASTDESKEDEDKMRGRSKGKITMIMVALCLASFLAALDVTIITVALPTIAENFGSASGYSWIGSSFLIANGAAVPIWGKISDVFGRKPMILLANVIFMVGSLVAALSYNIGMLITARAIQGIGAGGLVTLTNIIIGDLFALSVRGVVSLAISYIT